MLRMAGFYPDSPARHSGQCTESHGLNIEPLNQDVVFTKELVRPVASGAAPCGNALKSMFNSECGSIITARYGQLSPVKTG